MTRILVVSSFVEPRQGGVEQFVTWTRETLVSRGYEVRVLAGDGPGFQADVTVPMRWLTDADWPLPIGGRKTLVDEIRQADVVLINSHRHLLSIAAAVIARQQHAPARFIIHRAGEVPSSSKAYDAVATLFDHLLTPLGLWAAPPVSVSQAGVRYVEHTWNQKCAFLPYPARADRLEHQAQYNGQEPFRIVWAARMAHDKRPLLALDICRQLNEYRTAHLDMYGDGPLAAQVNEAATELPGLITVHGQQPWPTVIEAQRQAHVCLSTSAMDNVQLALLEPLARGIPCVATAVGDAPEYYSTDLQQYCPQPEKTTLLVQALDRLAGQYAIAERAFTENGLRLQTVHGNGHPERALINLVDQAGREHPDGNFEGT